MGFSDILADAVKGIPLNEVLRERIAFAEQQLAALDREAANLKLEKEVLETTNRDLRSQLQQCNAKVDALEAATKKDKGTDRPEQEHQMLIYLGKYSDLIEISQIVVKFKIGKNAAEFHLTNLEEADLVSRTFDLGGGAYYYLTQDGKRYLAERGLLS